MCTVLLAWRPGHAWPLLLGGNRDEMRDRPWSPPGRHWPDRPEVVGGLDRTAGGSWLALGDTGVVAVALNREGTLGPAPGKRSRGELVLDAAEHGDAIDAVTALTDIDPAAYRPFNLVVADDRDAFWLRSLGTEGRRVEAFPLPDGISMLTGHDLDDPGSRRIVRHRARLAQSALPEPDRGAAGWSPWIALLAARDRDPDDDKGRSAMCIETATGFATVSSALVALPDTRRGDRSPVFLFASGSPDRAAFEAVDRSPSARERAPRG